MNNLDEMIKLQEEFSELYWHGLTSVHSDSLHVTEDFFRRNFDNFKVKKRDNGKHFPYELQAKYKDTQFFCLTKEVDESENIKKESS